MADRSLVSRDHDDSEGEHCHDEDGQQGEIVHVAEERVLWVAELRRIIARIEPAPTTPKPGGSRWVGQEPRHSVARGHTPPSAQSAAMAATGHKREVLGACCAKPAGKIVRRRAAGLITPANQLIVV